MDENEVVNVRLIKNVKYNNNPYTMGESINIERNDIDKFKDAEAIDLTSIEVEDISNNEEFQ